MRQECPLFPFLFNIELDFLARATIQGQVTEYIIVGKKEVKLSLFMDDRILLLKATPKS
jgi:hypothetical protein